MILENSTISHFLQYKIRENCKKDEKKALKNMFFRTSIKLFLIINNLTHMIREAFLQITKCGSSKIVLQLFEVLK